MKMRAARRISSATCTSGETNLGVTSVAAPKAARWIAQEVVHLSTAPTVAPDGSLVPRHVDLRPFAVYGTEVRVIPGGLTRVALEQGSMIVNSSRGGGSKDTWVLRPEPGAITKTMQTLPARTELPVMPALGTGAWTSQQQQQQQAGGGD